MGPHAITMAIPGTTTKRLQLSRVRRPLGFRAPKAKIEDRSRRHVYIAI
jgi:hypothetical protein